MSTRKRFYYLSLMFGAIAAMLAGPKQAGATLIVYDVFGQTDSPITTGSGGGNGLEFQLNWSGLTLSHDTRGTASFADDIVRLQGNVHGCIGALGGDCSTSNSFRPRNSQIKGGRYLSQPLLGQGTFSLDATFGLDEGLTTTSDSIFADAQMGIGLLTLLDGTVYRHNTVSALTLKENPELGWAFRLFRDGPGNHFRIHTWLLAVGGALGVETRSETRNGEAVFNGEVWAVRRGGVEDPNPPVPVMPDPETEIPEPTTLLLLSSALAGAAYRRARVAI